MKYAVVAVQLVQRPLLVPDILKNALDSAFYELLEAVLTIPKFTAEWIDSLEVESLQLAKNWFINVPGRGKW